MIEKQEKIRVGVVGCGVVATGYYLPFLMNDEPRAEIAAVCDLEPVRAERSAELFGAKACYFDYFEMLEKAELDAVLILTGPGTHVRFAMAAIDAGLHFLIQKPMALNIEDADTIVDAVRSKGLKAVIEPSSNSPLDQDYRHMRELIDKGVLGNPYWFTKVPTAGVKYSPGMGGNPYGAEAFFTKDSGGVLFDYPYAPTEIVTLLGDCRYVSGMAKISKPEREIVPDSEYTRFMEKVTDPDEANYWGEVMHLPKSQKITMEAPDNVFSLYEMDSGAIGVFHVGRPFHPVAPGAKGNGGLQIFGTDGNLIFGAPGKLASFISDHRELLPSTDDEGWYHIPARGDASKAQWPKPTPGAFNYYAESTRELIAAIVEDRDPVLNVEWGRHITEMMYGALEASRTGRRYEMTSTTRGLRKKRPEPEEAGV